jgi:uncharacterized protein YuzE
MKDLRIEITDKGAALYIAVDPDGLWAKTTRPDDLITIDWDRQGRVIGIEAIGSAAREAINALVTALLEAPARDSQAVHDALRTLSDETPSEEHQVEVEQHRYTATAN